MGTMQWSSWYAGCGWFPLFGIMILVLHPRALDALELAHAQQNFCQTFTISSNAAINAPAAREASAR